MDIFPAEPGLDPAEFDPEGVPYLSPDEPATSIVVYEPQGDWRPEHEVLAEISRAQRALENAGSMAEILQVRDLASAWQIFAAAQGFREAEQEAAIFRLRAERQAGSWLLVNIPHQGGRPKQGQTDIVSLNELGIHPKESERWQKEARLPAVRFDRWVDECRARGWDVSAAALIRLSDAHSGKGGGSPDLPDIVALQRILERWFQPGEKEHRRATRIINMLIAMIREAKAKDEEQG